MKKNLYHILLIITCCLASCKKDKEEIKDFSLEALTNGSWKSLITDNNTSTNPSGGGTNTYWPVPDCRKDDIHTYNANGELLTNNGGTACTSDEPAAKQSYTIDLANKKLTVNGADYTILELSATRLKLNRVIPTTSGYGNIIYLFGHP